MTEANAPAHVKHRDFLLVTVPPANGAREFYLLDSHNNHKTTQALFWKDNTPSPPWVLLPPGSWQLIGLGSDLTEEQKKEIVGLMEHHDGFYGYPDFEGINSFYLDPVLAFNSLLRSNNLNPDTTVFLKLIES